MASCGACGTFIVLGGERLGEDRFCNKTCALRGPVLAAARAIPDANVRAFAADIHRGPCPRCAGPGPVDVRTSHSVWSAVLLTHWKSTPRLSCRGCGVKAQAGDLAFSAVVGWWGFPWGLLVTPVQIGRNLFGMVFAPDPRQPSAQLELHARMVLAERHAAPVLHY